MKLTINAILEGSEITQDFYKQLKDKGLDISLEDIKILVTNKSGAEVDISADKIKLVVNKS